ncbi:MAG: zf-HC2 domain-containing protein [Gemmatimonadales bacterium]
MNATCTSFRDHDTAARWVAGTLPAADRTAFEDHMVACADCQADVRLAVAVRGSWRQRRGPRWVAMGGLLAAAALLVVFVTGDETGQPKGQDSHLVTQAKAALGIGDTARAVDLLRQVPATDSLGAWARALLDSLNLQR